MRQIIVDSPWIVYALPALLVGLLGSLWVLQRQRRSPRQRLRKALRGIPHEYQGNLIIPNGDGGEIHIDHLVLTAEGLLVIDVKEVTGTVFGSDKMQDWTVIASDRRFTFANPQPAILDRVAAIRLMVQDAPVAGKILFLGGAEFSKGRPDLVCHLEDLLPAAGNQDQQSMNARLAAYRPHWDRVLAAARSAGSA